MGRSSSRRVEHPTISRTMGAISWGIVRVALGRPLVDAQLKGGGEPINDYVVLARAARQAHLLIPDFQTTQDDVLAANADFRTYVQDPIRLATLLVYHTALDHAQATRHSTIPNLGDFRYAHPRVGDESKPRVESQRRVVKYIRDVLVRETTRLEQEEMPAGSTSNVAILQRMLDDLVQTTPEEYYVRIFPLEKVPLLARINPRYFFNPLLATKEVTDPAPYTQQAVNDYMDTLQHAARKAETEGLEAAVAFFNQDENKSRFFQTNYVPRVTLDIEDIADLGVFIAARYIAAQTKRGERGDLEPGLVHFERGMEYLGLRLKDCLLFDSHHPLAVGPQNVFIVALQARLQDHRKAEQYLEEREAAIFQTITNTVDQTTAHVLKTAHEERRLLALRASCRQQVVAFEAVMTQFLGSDEDSLAGVLSFVQSHDMLAASTVALAILPAEVVDIAVFLRAQKIAIQRRGIQRPNIDDIQVAIAETNKFLDHVSASSVKTDVLAAMQARLATPDTYFLQRHKARVRKSINYLQAAKEAGVLNDISLVDDTQFQEQQKVCFAFLERLERMLPLSRPFSATPLQEALWDTRERTKLEKETRDYSLPGVLRTGTILDLQLWLQNNIKLTGSEFALARSRAHDPKEEQHLRVIEHVKTRLLALRADRDAWRGLGEQGQVNWAIVYSALCSPEELEIFCQQVVGGDVGDFQDLHALAARSYRLDPYEAWFITGETSHTALAGDKVNLKPDLKLGLSELWATAFSASRFPSQSQDPKYARTLSSLLKRMEEVTHEMSYQNAYLVAETVIGTGVPVAFAWSYGLQALEARDPEKLRSITAAQAYPRVTNLLAVITPEGDKPPETVYISMVAGHPGLAGNRIASALVQELLRSGLSRTSKPLPGDIEIFHPGILAILRTINHSLMTLYNGLLFSRNPEYPEILPMLLGYVLDTKTNPPAFRLLLGYASAENAGLCRAALVHEFSRWQSDRTYGHFLTAFIGIAAYYRYAHTFGETTQQAHLMALPTRIAIQGLDPARTDQLYASLEADLQVFDSLAQAHAAAGREDLTEFQEALTALQQKLGIARPISSV